MPTHDDDTVASTTNPVFRAPLPATWPLEAPAADSFVYGPDVADEHVLRLLGTVEGKRILELGVGNGANGVWLARQGAKVISVDPSRDAIDAARDLAERHEVKVEHHQGDLADVAFVRADGIDLVVSVWGLAGESDIDRVFRQAHRVLRPECPLVVSLPHPTFELFDLGGAEPDRLAHSYFDTAPRAWRYGTREGVEHVRTVGDLVGGLFRANFRLDSVLEPAAERGTRSRWRHEVMDRVPSTIILRARKLGI